MGFDRINVGQKFNARNLRQWRIFNVARRKKFTYKDLYNDFCKNHPKLKKKILWWCPCGYMTIMLYLDEGVKLLYDGSTFRSKFIYE